MTIRRLLLLFMTLQICLAASKIGAAEQVVTFTPESLYKTIDEKNTAIRLGRLVIDEADAGVSVAKSSYMPDISASWQVGYLGDGYLTDRNFSNGMHVPNPHFVNNLALEAMQLIYTGGAVTGGVRMSEIAKRLSELSYDEDRQQVRFVLMSQLIDLQCLEKQKDVIATNIGLAQQLLETMRARHSEGVVLKSDITRYELLVSDLQLQSDRLAETIDNLNHRIATSLGYPEGTRFVLDVEPITETYAMPTVGQWQDLASANNLAMQKAKMGIDLKEAQLKVANSERLPHVGAFVYGNFTSPIVTEVPVLNKNFLYWGFGLNVSYNISSIYKGNKSVRKARIAVKEGQEQLELAKESVNDNVNDAYNAWLTACSALRTQRSSLRLAEENYEIVSDRFGEGMALVTDLVDAANVKIAAQTGLENAASRLLYCLYKLRYLSNTL